MRETVCVGASDGRGVKGDISEILKPTRLSLSLYFLSCYLSFLFFFFFRVTYGGLRGFFSKRGIIKTGVGGRCLCLCDLGEKKVR